MISKITVKIAVAGLMTVAGMSGGAITDINLIPGSNFGTYALIVGAQNPNPSNHFVGGSPSSIGTSALNGNADFGFNANSTDIQLFGDTITGNVATTGTSANCVSNGPCYAGTLAGLLNGAAGVNATTGAGAILDATSLAATYLAYGTTTTALPKIANGTTALDVTATPGFHPGGNVNENVYFVNAAFASNLTITLTPSQYVVIDLGSGNGLVANVGESLFGITLAGLTGVANPYDHVLINVGSSGVLMDSATANGAINADVIDAYGQVTLASTTLNGRLYCTVSPGSCSINQSTTISASINTAPGPVPEPPTLLIGASLVAIGLTFRWRRSRSTAA